MERLVLTAVDTPHRPRAVDARRDFKKKYLSRLLPIIMKIRQQKSVSTIHDRIRAVKFAVDMSFALTAKRVGGVTWGRALSKELLGRRRLKGSKEYKSGVDLGRLERRRRRKSLKHGWHRERLRVRRCIYKRSVRRSCRFEVGIQAASSSSYSESRTREGKTERKGKIQMKSLRFLIPGGGAMNAATLLKETTHYIVALEMQVEALETLTKVV